MEAYLVQHDTQNLITLMQSYVFPFPENSQDLILQLCSKAMQNHFDYSNASNIEPDVPKVLFYNSNLLKVQFDMDGTTSDFLNPVQSYEAKTYSKMCYLKNSKDLRLSNPCKSSKWGPQIVAAYDSQATTSSVIFCCLNFKNGINKISTTPPLRKENVHQLSAGHISNPNDCYLITDEVILTVKPHNTPSPWAVKSHLGFKIQYCGPAHLDKKTMQRYLSFKSERKCRKCRDIDDSTDRCKSCQLKHNHQQWAVINDLLNQKIGSIHVCFPGESMIHGAASHAVLTVLCSDHSNNPYQIFTSVGYGIVHYDGLYRFLDLTADERLLMRNDGTLYRSKNFAKYVADVVDSLALVKREEKSKIIERLNSKFKEKQIKATSHTHTRKCLKRKRDTNGQFC